MSLVSYTITICVPPDLIDETIRDGRHMKLAAGPDGVKFGMQIVGDYFHSAVEKLATDLRAAGWEVQVSRTESIIEGKKLSVTQEDT